jgi:UDP-N-acetylglucosamine acyltransferase
MDAKIHPSAVIAENVQLGKDVTIGPNCVIEEGSAIGDGTALIANVVIGKFVKIGKNNQIFPFASIGMPPQLLGADTNQKFGSLTIGDNNIIREQATIHPGMYPGGGTAIGNENFLMIGIHLGHDCILEDKIVISNYSQISGHCKIETGVWLSGMVAVHQFVTFGKWCYASGFAGINHDVPPFVMVSGHYPPQIRAINKRGLQRAGLDDQQKKAVFSAFKKIYRNGDGVFIDRVNEVNRDNGHDENVRAIIDAILKSQKHRFGRYLETFRD